MNKTKNILSTVFMGLAVVAIVIVYGIVNF